MLEKLNNDVEGLQSEGSTRYSYEAGDAVHGKVDASRAQQEGGDQRSLQNGPRIRGIFSATVSSTAPTTWHTLPESMRKLGRN